MIDQIGFYIPVVTPSPEHNNILNVLNDLSDGYVNTIVFNTTFNTNIHNRKFCLLPSVGAKYFRGALFCFDTHSFDVISTFPSPCNKFFVTDDIFWQDKQTPLSSYMKLIDNKTSIIALNKKCYDLYSICFRAPIMNMENGFTSKGCLNVLQTI